MRILYPDFYRKFGIRSAVELARPRLFPIETFQLPINSILHVLPPDDNSIGPGDNSEYYNGFEKSLYVNMVMYYHSSGAGILTKSKTPKLPYMQEFFKTHVNFNNVLREKTAPNIAKNLVIYDYSLIHRDINYRENVATDYLRWLNGFETFINEVKDCPYPERYHFLEFVVPERLLPLSVWQLFQDDVATRKPDLNGIRFRQDYIRRFDTDSVRFISDLWLLLGHSNQSKHSVLNSLSIEQASKLNIIIRAGGKYSILNIGTLMTWLKRDTDGNEKSRSLVPLVARKRFMALMMVVNKARSLNATDIENPEDNVEVDNGEDELSTGEVAATAIVDGANGADPLKKIDVDMNKVKEGTHTVKLDQTVTKSSDKPVTPVDTNGIVKQDGSSDKLAEDVATVLDTEIDKDLEQLEFIEKQTEVEDLYTKYTPYEPPSDNPVEAAIDIAQDAAQRGLLSAAEYRRLTKKAERFLDLPNPFGTKDGTFAQAITYTQEDLVIDEAKTKLVPKIKGVLDESMLSSSLQEIYSKYPKLQLNKDVAQCVLSAQRCGIILDDYKVNEYEDINDSYSEHVFKFIPVRGEPSTCRVRVPKIDVDGTFKAGGVKYNMRRQRGDYPIHKTKPFEVALTSYYSKMFVRRADRRMFNYEIWLSNQIRARGINPEDPSVQGMEMQDVFQNEYKGSRVYSALSKYFSSFVVGQWQFRLDYSKVKAYFGDIKEVAGHTPIARNIKTNSVLFISDDGTLTVNDKSIVPATIEELIGIDPVSAPVDMAEVGLFGKQLPLGFILAYQAGLGNLLETIKAKYRTVPRGSQLKLQWYEFAVRFENETMIFDKRQKVVSLLMSGFNRYHRDLRQYPRQLFDKKDVYGAVLDNNEISSRRLRECEVLFPMWVDPITKDILESMEMPTDLFNLFLKATELLTTDEYPEPLERDRGYERIAGMIYTEMIKSIRGYQSKPNSATAQVTMNPMAVWMTIIQDQTVSPVEDSNPYQALKDTEVVVYRGEGGRSARSMTTETRKLTKRQMGVTSEATVDNGDVGTIAYTSANPNYSTLRGTTKVLESFDDRSKILSTSALLAPGATLDDPKRINFINIQNSQTTHAEGYTPLPMRTGYERVIGHRTPPLYCTTSKKEGGVVKEVNKKSVVVEYPDGEVVSVETGRIFGKWSGKVIPHEIITEVQVGQKLPVGAVIAYNKHFFQRDVLDPSQVLLKPGVLARTVLWESTGTLEDSCGLSAEFAAKLGTSSTHIRNIPIRFDQEIMNTVKVNESVDPESILCTVYNPVGGASDLYEGDSLNTIQDLESLNPKAEYTGKVEKIELRYCGETEDMSESLRMVADASDTRLYRERKEMRKRTVDGRVDPGFRIDGKTMHDNMAMLSLYITGNTGMGIGDKCVFALQMKSVVGNIYPVPMKSKDGKNIDADFGYLSIMNRIVNSAPLIGTTSTLCVALAEMVVNAYDNGKPK